MEHIRKAGTIAVLARFLRRYWRFPAQVVGVLSLLLILLFSLPFLPHVPGRVEASSDRPDGVAGSIESLQSRGVGTPFAGQVAVTFVTEGQAVKKGDPLFTMDVTSLLPQLASARAELASARAEVSALARSRSEELAPLRAQVSSLRSEIAAERARQAPVVIPNGESVAIGFEEVFAPPAPEPDGERIRTLSQALAVATYQLEDRSRTWGPVLADANERTARARRNVAKVQGLIASAERRSPMAGIVTDLRIAGSQWVEAHQPVVRVDDPKAYRAVILVDEPTRDSLQKGARVPVNIAGRQAEARLEKIVPGWDKELYSYWLYLKPDQPTALRPGEQVTLQTGKG